MLFGCNVPRLIAIIVSELKLEEKYRNGEIDRTFYDFDELTPEEKEREALLFALEEVRLKNCFVFNFIFCSVPIECLL